MTVIHPDYYKIESETVPVEGTEFPKYYGKMTSDILIGDDNTSEYIKMFVYNAISKKWAGHYQVYKFDLQIRSWVKLGPRVEWPV